MVSTKQKEPSSVVEGRKTMLPGILRFRKKQQTSPAPTSDLQKQKAEEPKSNIVNRSFNKRQRRDKKSEKVAEDQKTLATTPGRGGICDFSNLFDFYFDWNDSRQIKIETQTTTVTLEVAALTESRCTGNTSQNSGTLKGNEPQYLSSTVVGVAQRCDEKAIDYGIIVGQRVASIWPSRHGTSQTNVSIPSNNLLPVPNDVDAADIACIMAFYLPAFQVLHHGQRNELRYSKLRFCDMRILITGGATQLVKSIIRLAKYGGARDIFVIAPKEEHILLNQIENVTTLSEDREEWFPTIDAEMDLIIDCSFPKDFQFIRLALAPKGRLICYPTWDARPGTSKSSSEFDYLLEFCQLCTMKRACIFDLQQSAEDSREELEDDLEFLLYLLDKRKIRPVFTRYKNPNDIIRRAGQSSQRRVDALVFEPVTAKRIF